MRTLLSRHSRRGILGIALFYCGLGGGLGAAAAAPKHRAAVALDAVAAPAAPALSGLALDKAVSEALSGYEPLEMRGAIVQLGPAAAEVLLRIARDTRFDGLIRLRAIEALGYLPNEASRSYLLLRLSTASRADDGEAMWTAATLRALAGFSDPQPLLPFLDHASVEVRESAAWSLRALGNRAVLPELLRRLPGERDRAVHAALEDAVRALSAPRR